MTPGAVDQDGSEARGARALTVLGRRVADVAGVGGHGPVAREGPMEDHRVRLRHADLARQRYRGEPGRQVQTLEYAHGATVEVADDAERAPERAQSRERRHHVREDLPHASVLEVAVHRVEVGIEDAGREGGQEASTREDLHHDAEPHLALEAGNRFRGGSGKRHPRGGAEGPGELTLEHRWVGRDAEARGDARVLRADAITHPDQRARNVEEDDHRHLAHRAAPARHRGRGPASPREPA